MTNNKRAKVTWAVGLPAPRPAARRLEDARPVWASHPEPPTPRPLDLHGFRPERAEICFRFKYRGYLRTIQVYQSAVKWKKITVQREAPRELCVRLQATSHQMMELWR